MSAGSRSPAAGARPGQPLRRSPYAGLAIAGTALCLLAGCGPGATPDATPATSPTTPANATGPSQLPGGGGPPGTPPTKGVATTPAHRAGVTWRQGRRLARQRAGWIAAQARMPAGSRRLSAAPEGTRRPLNQDASGTPGGTSVADAIRYYRLPMPPLEAIRWLLFHAPHGWASTGRSTGSGPSQPTTYGITFDVPGRTPAWESSRSYDVSLTALGSRATALRVDGTVVWLDPRPRRVHWPARRAVRVTVAGGCPRSVRDRYGVVNHRPGLADQLLPAQAPTAALVCRYDGLNAHPPQSLVRSRRLGGAGAAALARLVGRMSLRHIDGAFFSCPADQAVAVVVAFTYRRGPDVDLWYDPEGCGGLFNGWTEAGGAGGAPGPAYGAFARRLTQLVGSTW